MHTNTNPDISKIFNFFYHIIFDRHLLARLANVTHIPVRNSKLVANANTDHTKLAPQVVRNGQ